MKKLFSVKIYTAALFCLMLTATVNSQTYDNKKEAEKNVGQGITFKIPDKFMNAPMNGFKGLAMLNPDAPAAVFVSYPNEGESVEALNKRILNAIPGLFFGSKEKEFAWMTKNIEVNQGDKTASLNTTDSSGNAIRVALFQREWNGLFFVYGYFAMKNKESKQKDLNKYWLDDNGKGVKPFEKFVKTFPKNSN